MRRAGGIATAAIVALALATAYIHYTLGSLIFLLNAAGYVTLATLVVVGATVDQPFVRRFRWLPNVGLAGFAMTTIAAYLVIGPYFSLGWVAKGIEVTLVGLIAIDLVRVYGSPAGLIRAALDSIGFERRLS